MTPGVSATAIPHSARIRFLAWAVSSSPPTMAPAWPMRRPAGAVAPAMNPAMGFLQCSFAQRAASTSAVAADLADQDDRLGFRIFVEHLEHVEMGGAVDRIPADADAGALAVAELGELPDGLVGQGAGTGNHADVAALVDVSRERCRCGSRRGFSRRIRE